MHVDDLFVIFSCSRLGNELEKQLRRKYNTIKVQEGRSVSYVGMYFTRNDNYTVSAKKIGYVEGLLRRYNDSIDNKVVVTPSDTLLFTDDGNGEPVNQTWFSSLLMSLMYIALRTRPDIIKEVAYLSTHMQNPTKNDVPKLVRILRYLNGTKDRGITFSNDDMNLSVWIDASYAIHDDAKSQSAVVITVGDHQGPLYVRATKQKYMTTSSTWSELAAIHDGMSTILWCRQLLEDLGFKQAPTTIYQDNQSTIKLAYKGEGASAATKHLKVRYFYVKENLDSKEIAIEYCPTDYMIADIMTKPTDARRFGYHRDRMMNTNSGDVRHFNGKRSHEELN